MMPEPQADRSQTLFSRRYLAALAVVALMGAMGLLVGVPATGATEARALHISTLSNRPDKLSGDNVLVAIDLPQSVAPSDVVVKLNGSVVSAALVPQSGSNRLVGMVSGLRSGRNVLTASARGAANDRLELTNHAATGPVFSGPQQTPFYCQTHQFRVYPGGPFLTDAKIEAPCHVPTRVDFLYRTAAGGFAALDPGGPMPTGIIETTTSTGERVPYIVRLETGTINRSIYQTAVLNSPREPWPAPGAGPRAGWNGRLVHNFGGGCQPGWYVQGASALFSSAGSEDPDFFLSKGYAVSTASLTVLGNNCNFVLAAETMMMVKEHVIETLGVPLYTMGWGCSGGAVLQNMVANAYPGLLDGIVPQCSFADISNVHGLDSRLLYNYYKNGGAGVPWAEDQIVKVSGFHDFAHVRDHGAGRASRYDPHPSRPGLPPNSSGVFFDIVPANVRYDPVSNPQGVRATLWDSMANLFGRDARGYGRSPLDNAGIQYGLAALNSGQISKAQFLDLNEKIGGMSVDGDFTRSRTVADPKAIKAAYETGFFNTTQGGLGTTAILDIDNMYTDQDSANGDPHAKFQHFATRERISAAHGNADNMVMWNGVLTPYAREQTLMQMDAWLTNLAADKTAATLRQKVIRSKPAGLRDGCWDGRAFTAEPQFLGGAGSSTCNSLYPGWTFPRFVAGSRLAHDVVQCQRRPIDLKDYKVAFSAAELTRLRNIYSGGVCDYARPGPNQAPLLGTWLTYTGGGKYSKDRLRPL